MVSRFFSAIGGKFKQARTDAAKINEDNMPPPRYIHPPSAAVKTETTLDKNFVTQVSPSKESSLSILTKIENGVKTLAHDAEDALKLFIKDEPKIEAVAATTLATISPLVVAVTAVATGNPAVATAAAAVLTAIQTKLAAAQVVIVSLSSASSAKSLLTLVQADLAQLLAVVGVKDPALTATITADVNKISAAIAVILAAL